MEVVFEWGMITASTQLNKCFESFRAAPTVHCGSELDYFNTVWSLDT